MAETRTPCPRNACQGGYGKCMDVKLTNQCDSCCSFCIERGGWSPAEATAAEMASAARAEKEYPDMLILGGEPLMDCDRLLAFLAGTRAHKSHIYMTTNGKYLTREHAELIGPYLDGVNISIHHYDEQANGRVLGRGGPSFDELTAAVEALHGASCRVRVNANLVRGYLDTRERVDRMVALAGRLGADEIRFTELQDVGDDLFVDARGMFPELSSVDPFYDGCEQEVSGFPGVRVVVKVSCGCVNARRERPADVSMHHSTKVLYPDGTVMDGWVRDEQMRPRRWSEGPADVPSCMECHGISGGCHSPYAGLKNYSGVGCHTIGAGCHIPADRCHY